MGGLFDSSRRLGALVAQLEEHRASTRWQCGAVATTVTSPAPVATTFAATLPVAPPKRLTARGRDSPDGSPQGAFLSSCGYSAIARLFFFAVSSLPCRGRRCI